MNEGVGEPVSLWLGGGTGSGKSTIARAIAHRHDLALYRVDARGYEHRERLVERGLMSGVPKVYDDRWLAPTADHLAREFVDASVLVMGCIVEDLRASDAGVITLVEGPQLLPSQVAPRLRDAAHGLWLIPAASFRQQALATRATDASKFTSDEDRALRKRLERDAIIDAQICAEARAEGLTVFAVDGRHDLSTMISRVTDHFRSVIEAGPRLADGAQRQRLRRDENLAMWRNACAFLDDLGTAAPSDPPSLHLACECETLGCDAVAEATPAEYERVIQSGSVIASPACVGR